MVLISNSNAREFRQTYYLFGKTNYIWWIYEWIYYIEIETGFRFSAANWTMFLSRYLPLFPNSMSVYLMKYLMSFVYYKIVYYITIRILYYYSYIISIVDFWKKNTAKLTILVRLFNFMFQINVSLHINIYLFWPLPNKARDSNLSSLVTSCHCVMSKQSSESARLSCTLLLYEKILTSIKL